MNLPTDILQWSVIMGLWTFMWLTWSFKGDVRAWLAALLFPSSWLVGASRLSIAALSYSGFTKWLIQGSLTPPLVCHVMTCQFCWSAHVAGVGTTLLFLTVNLPLLSAPWIWVGGAAIGNILYVYTYRNHSD